MFWSATKIQETLKAENELGSFQLVTGCGQGQTNKQNSVPCKQVLVCKRISSFALGSHRAGG